MLLLVLTGLAWMVQIMSMMKFLLNYGIQLTNFLGLTMLMVPFIISIIVPFVTFIAIIFVYNKMISDNEIAIEWARIPHFYTPFYVYQYATGFAAAIALSGRILELGEQGVADYMKFLTGGCSKDPIELLKLAGVDMTDKKSVRDALAMFADLVDELDSLV